MPEFVKKCIKKLIPLWKSIKTHISISGGRGGAKSWEGNDWLLMQTMQRPGMVFLSTREIQKSIKKSNYATLRRRIRELGLEDHFRIKSDMIENINGAEIHFEGLRSNIDSILSMDNIGGIHFEEASFVTRNSIDLLLPTALRYPGIRFLWTWNPRFIDDCTYQMFKAKDSERIEGFPYDFRTKYDDKGNIISEPATIIDVNWTDNIHLYRKNPDGSWVHKEWHEEVARMYELDHEFADHIYGGKLWYRSDAAVFVENRNWKIDKGEKVLKTIPNHALDITGMDLGFNDPTCIVEAKTWDRNIYITGEVYETEVPADDISDRVMQKSRNARDGHPIRIDSSNKQVVAMLENLPENWNIIRATKGPGSIEQGITFLYGYRIWIHPDCVNAIREFRKYSYEVDNVTGMVNNKKIVDKDNHIPDALRYAVEDLRRSSRDGDIYHADVSTY